MIASHMADDGLSLLGDVLLDARCMCHIGSIACDSFEIKVGSSQLDYHCESLEPGATKLLCGVLKYNAVITALNLSGRSIATDAASTLAIAIKANTTSKRPNAFCNLAPRTCSYALTCSSRRSPLACSPFLPQL